MSAVSPNNAPLWGIIGGIFDPIHYGHLVLAESALEAYHYDKIIFIPSFNPPHRGQKPVASFEDRCLMVNLAIEGNERFELSRLESELKSPGYTLTIVDYLRQKFPLVKWQLILGADNIAAFDTWHRPDELVQRVKIVVGNRHGYDEDFQRSKWAAVVEKFDMPLLEISSTFIRDSIKGGRSIRYLLPEDVRQFVLSRGLYR